MAKPITPEEMTAYVEATWNKCQEEAWQEQEPVGYAHVEDLKREHHDFYVNRQRGINEVPLYTAPPHKRSIAEDVGRLLNSGKGFYDDGTPIDPKAIQLRMEGVGDGVVTFTEVLIPRPPKQWVGLTDDEIKEIVGPWGDTPIKGYTRKLFDQIEAKLREKNQ